MTAEALLSKLYDAHREDTDTEILWNERIQLIEAALKEAFDAGVTHRCVPKNMVSVHGSDGCLNCETGRITIYAASRWCLECQHKKHAEQNKEL